MSEVPLLFDIGSPMSRFWSWRCGSVPHHSTSYEKHGLVGFMGEEEERGRERGRENGREKRPSKNSDCRRGVDRPDIGSVPHRSISGLRCRVISGL